MEFEQLFIKINSGESLLPEEIQEIVSKASLLSESKNLGGNFSFDDCYNLLMLFEKLDLKNHRHIVARFLEVSEPQIVCLALELLCKKWQHVDEYLDSLLHFSLGLEWDKDGDVQEIASEILTSIKSNLHPKLHL